MVGTKRQVELDLESSLFDTTFVQPDPEVDSKVDGATSSLAKWQDADDASLVVNISTNARLKKLRVAEDETDVRGLEYQRRLQHFYEAQQSNVSWAQIKEDEEGEEEEALFQSSTNLISGSSAASATLPSGHLDIKRVKDANIAAPASAVIQSIGFHPSNGQCGVIYSCVCIFTT